MGKKLAIEHHLIRPNEVIELLEMMGGKNKDNADGCSFLYYTLCTPKINNPNNEKIICGFTNLKMQNDYFAIFTLEKFWKKYPYKLNELVLCDDGLLGVITKMEWDCEKCDMKYHVSFNISDYNKWYSSKNIKCKFMAAKNKKLAIKGHPTRGKEVIELLEMMGGSNIHNLSGNDIYSYYIIKGFKNEIHEELYIFSNENIYYFTLEEFWEKYPFKFGDKVIDKADGCPGVVCAMKWDEGLSDMKYCVAFGNGIDFGWYANGSIEFCKENKNLEENNFPPFEPMFKMNDELEYMVPDGYEITEVSKDKVFIKPIKSKYPKTYEECCEIIGISRHDVEIDLPQPYQQKMFNLFKLCICRDTYWKIASEEMGLDKPWKPKFGKGILFSINFYLYQNSFVLHKGEYNSSDNCILVFPTSEMRDAFYDNFKVLIEQCKELL